MKRTNLILAAALIAVLSPTGAALADQPSPSAHTTRAATVSQRQTSLGRILVSSSGRTLYEFTRDHSGSSACAAISGCSETWPALLSSGKPLAGPGVHAAELSTIKLPGGGRQVTYAGHPLYLYSGDSGPGETSYVGVRQFGGSWYALSSSARAVK
jgi:predicted lipoprotein with Yx(FWY)xxD motif